MFYENACLVPVRQSKQVRGGREQENGIKKANIQIYPHMMMIHSQPYKTVTRKTYATRLGLHINLQLIHYNSDNTNSLSYSFNKRWRQFQCHASLSQLQDFPRIANSKGKSEFLFIPH